MVTVPDCNIVSGDDNRVGMNCVVATEDVHEVEGFVFELLLPVNEYSTY